MIRNSTEEGQQTEVAEEDLRSEHWSGAEQ